MIQYLTNENIDRRKWDDCIARSFNGIVYAYSWYLDIVSPEWEALVKDDYKSVMPLTWRRKYGIKYLFQPFYTQQLGVFSTEKSDTYLVQKFLEAIPKPFQFVEISLNTFNHFNIEDIQVKQSLTHELDLIESYENIAKNYSDNLKRNLKKAQYNKLQIAFVNQPEPVITLFRKNRGSTISNLKERDYKTLILLMHQAIHRGKAQVVNVMNEQNALCAGAFFMESNNKVIFLFSGLSEEGKNLNAMPFLIDSFIKQNAGKNITLDFEGSNDINIARFYKSFGSKECVYPQIKINSLPFPLSMLKR
ncbi:MAG: hypothetical protein AB7G44_17195 [Bacteroidia bacterium]